MSLPNTAYRITENGFSYTYVADGYSGAIAQWLAATFIEGCTASEPDNAGRFMAWTPLGSTVHARITRDEPDAARTTDRD